MFLDAPASDAVEEGAVMKGTGPPSSFYRARAGARAVAVATLGASRREEMGRREF